VQRLSRERFDWPVCVCVCMYGECPGWPVCVLCMYMCVCVCMLKLGKGQVEGILIGLCVCVCVYGECSSWPVCVCMYECACICVHEYMYVSSEF
jgi:hypothetical protein